MSAERNLTPNQKKKYLLDTLKSLKAFVSTIPASQERHIYEALSYSLKMNVTDSTEDENKSKTEKIQWNSAWCSWIKVEVKIQMYWFPKVQKEEESQEHCCDKSEFRPRRRSISSYILFGCKVKTHISDMATERNLTPNQKKEYLLDIYAESKFLLKMKMQKNLSIIDVL